MNDEINLTQAVERFAALIWPLSDKDLEREWNWRAYHEGVRYACFRTYEELRTLAAVLIPERSSKNHPLTSAHTALAQYHAAYRDLQAVLLGVGDALLDTPPTPGEWPLRIILGHTIAAEREFFARIWHAIQQYRNDKEEVVAMTTQAVAEFVGSYEDFERTMNRLRLAGILAFYESLHKRVLRELTDIRGFELEAESLWWEEVPMSVEFRLHRLDAHLRQHTIQVEKTLAALIGPPSEARRLLRLIYAALAEVDGAIIGAWDTGREKRRELAGVIANRAEEIDRIFGN
jgi:hypothetical protein